MKDRRCLSMYEIYCKFQQILIVWKNIFGIKFSKWIFNTINILDKAIQ